jgi:uncharacterized Zn-finger protein
MHHSNNQELFNIEASFLFSSKEQKDEKEERCVESIDGTETFAVEKLPGQKRDSLNSFKKNFETYFEINEVTGRHNVYRKCKHPDCGKVFNKKSNLLDHIRTHYGNKPFKCETCE